MDGSRASALEFDNLKVKVYPNRLEMGRAAAEAVAGTMRELLEQQERVSMVFAAAPSQDEFLASLAAAQGVDWRRVIAFHMDEYLGLPADAPQRFGNFLKERIFDKVRPGVVHYLGVGVTGPEAETQRYASLLSEHTLDIACMGIGQNGHIAFNDPPVADFDDPLLVKVVELDERSRQQQVYDGCFARLDAVPRCAITMTIPALTSARWVHCIVPDVSKAESVRNCLCGPIATACPASILRRHPRAVLYLDPESASLLLHEMGLVPRVAWPAWSEAVTCQASRSRAAPGLREEGGGEGRTHRSSEG